MWSIGKLLTCIYMYMYLWSRQIAHMWSIGRLLYMYMYLWSRQIIFCGIQLLIHWHTAHVVHWSCSTGSRPRGVSCGLPTHTHTCRGHVGSRLVMHIPETETNSLTHICIMAICVMCICNNQPTAHFMLFEMRFLIGLSLPKLCRFNNV